MRILQLTDIHLLPEAGNRLRGVDTAATLNRVLQKIKMLDPYPELAIVTGDLAEDGSSKTYVRLQNRLDTLQIPVYVLPGNHDDVVKMKQFLCNEQIRFSSYCHFKGWGFCFLNTQIIGKAHGFLEKEELSKLQSNLKNNGNKPTFIALHHTPAQQCTSIGCQLENAEDLLALAQKHPHVKGIMAGHTHQAELQIKGKIKLFTSPSTFIQVAHTQIAGPDGEFRKEHKIDKTSHGFRFFDLSPHGEICSEVVYV